MIGKYLGQLLFIVCNQSSNTIKVTITPLIVKCLLNVLNSQVDIKERSPFEADDASIIRLDTIKLLLKSLPIVSTKNDNVDSECIGFLLETIGKSYYITSIRDLAKDIVSSIGYSCANLFVNHVELYIYALQYAPELGFIIKSCPDLFESDYDLFERHAVYLLQTFSFVGLEAAIKDIALYEPLRLTKLVPSLINQIATSYMAGDIIIVLLRIAVVDPSGFKDNIQKLFDSCALNPTLCKTPFFALLAVCSKVGVTEVVMIFNMLQKIITHDLVSSMHLSDQSSLIGAVDVITDKLSQEVKISPEGVAALTKISNANPRAFENIMRWQKNKWARKGNLEYYVKQLNIVPVPKKAKKQVQGRRLGLSYFGSKNFLQRSNQSMLDAEKRTPVIVQSTSNSNENDDSAIKKTTTTKTRFSFFGGRKDPQIAQNDDSSEPVNAGRRKGKFNFSFVSKNQPAAGDGNANNVVSTSAPVNNIVTTAPIIAPSTPMYNISTTMPYNSATMPYNSAIPPYNSTTSPYNSAISPYNSAISPYNSAIPPYNSTISPYNSAIPPYNSAISPYNSTLTSIVPQPEVKVVPTPPSQRPSFINNVRQSFRSSN